MRIIAILASFNEARFIQHAIRHLAQQGVESYLLDNESTDGTLDLARQLQGQGLMGWEVLPRNGVYAWSEILAAKERVASQQSADWFLHQDCDEFRLPPEGYPTLMEALQVVDHEGYNAVHFDEYTFQPVLEAPDHDHDRFLQTMRWFYPFAPFPLHRLNAWKASVGAVNLQGSGGHQVAFPGRLIAPLSFRMRHYMMLSHRQAITKYRLVYDQKSVDIGWFGWRSRSPRGPLVLPPARALMDYTCDADLKPVGSPLKQHILGELWDGRIPLLPREPGWRWRLHYQLQRWRSRWA